MAPVTDTELGVTARAAREEQQSWAFRSGCRRFPFRQRTLVSHHLFPWPDYCIDSNLIPSRETLSINWGRKEGTFLGPSISAISLFRSQAAMLGTWLQGIITLACYVSCGIPAKPRAGFSRGSQPLAPGDDRKKGGGNKTPRPTTEPSHLLSPFDMGADHIIWHCSPPTPPVSGRFSLSRSKFRPGGWKRRNVCSQQRSACLQKVRCCVPQEGQAFIWL